MRYRKFGSLDWEASALGFSAGRLPCASDNGAGLDRVLSIEIIRHALDHGINCLDLGYPYDLQRQERIACAVGEALTGGYYEKARVFVTLPSHLIHSFDDFQQYLDMQLNWLQIRGADFCVLGRLTRENWPVLQNLGFLEWADEILDTHRKSKFVDTHNKGLNAKSANGPDKERAEMDTHYFENIGFSFHDHFQELKSVLASYDRWACCQFEFSYMDVDHDPGISGIKYAAEKGLAVMVSNPLKGGRLTKAPPEPVLRVWAEADPSGRMADLGLRFIWSHSEITTVYCDASSPDEISEAVLIADRTDSSHLMIREEIAVSRAREEYRKLRRIPCSSCRPCMPCPAGIDVPRIFEIYNEVFMYDDIETARSIYRSELHNLNLCTRCRECEERCVKMLSIIDWLDEARQFFELPSSPEASSV